MLTVPDSVKTCVDKLIKAYENLDSESNAEELKKLRRNLNTREGKLFEGADKEVYQNVYDKIEYFLYYIPVSLVREIIYEVHVQSQLIKALEKASNSKDALKANDAMNLMEFIQQAKHVSWSQADAYVERRRFKLVSKEMYEKMLSRKEVTELTPGAINPYRKIRVAMEEEDTYTQYRKKHIFRKFSTLCKKYNGEGIDAFNFWYDVKDTAIYYVYIPSE